jgi:hypothetical protein
MFFDACGREYFPKRVRLAGEQCDFLLGLNIQQSNLRLKSVDCRCHIKDVAPKSSWSRDFQSAI